MQKKLSVVLFLYNLEAFFISIIKFHRISIDITIYFNVWNYNYSVISHKSAAFYDSKNHFVCKIILENNLYTTQTDTLADSWEECSQIRQSRDER